MYCLHHTHAGLTFIELLLYMSLALIMVVLLGRIGVDVLESRLAASAREEVGYHSQLISEDLRRSFENASGVTSPANNASSSTLVLTMRDPQLSPTIYSFDGEVFWKQEGQSEPRTLHADSVAVSGVYFLGMHTDDQPGSVWVEILLESTQSENVYVVLQTAYSIPW